MITKHQSHLPYIDGLRSVAIISVFLFHASPKLAPNGFLGVDVFFVISGFVITRMITRKHAQGIQLSLKEFYINRFMRLYPALLLMLVATSFTYIFFGFQWDTNRFIKSVSSSLVGVSNIYFLSRGNEYFHDELVNPLTHTWSLGVEEQFYIIYPLLLSLFSSFFLRKKNYGIAFLLLCLTASLLCYLYGNNILGSYFSPLARFWEIILGCVVYLYSEKFKPNYLSNAILMSYFSLSILVLLLFIPFPYTSTHTLTLLSCLCTSIILFSELPYLKYGNIYLVNCVSIFLGKISYSFYLWHLPVIYYLSLYAPDYALLPLSLASTLLLGYISWRYVEIPFKSSTTLRRFITRSLYYSKHFAAFAVITGIILASKLSDVNQPLHYTISLFLDKKIKAYNYIESTTKLGERISTNYSFPNIDLPSCRKTDSNPVRGESLRGDCYSKSEQNILFFLTGDSHAEHLLPAFSQMKPLPSLYFQRFDTDNIGRHGDNEVFLQKLKESQQMLDSVSTQGHTIIQFFSLFLDQDKYDEHTINKRLSEYISGTIAYGPIVLIAPTPVFESGPSACILLGRHCAKTVKDIEARRTSVLNTMRELSRKTANVYVYDPTPALCRRDECKIFDYKKNLLYFNDSNHLSIEVGTLLSLDITTWLNNVALVSKSHR